MKKKYDVAFSFAGEQRDYVQATYEELVKHEVSVFYDAAQAVDLLGKNLYVYLSDVYQNQARYCVAFLSYDYANKAWTRRELEIIQARAFQESREYILPGRFDDTEIPGLLPTIAYVDLSAYTPQQFAKLIAEKVVEENVGQKADINPELEAHLADAVLWAEDYLGNVPLSFADAIAESVRSSFRRINLKPKPQDLRPYIRNTRAAYRVVGYIAYQIDPLESMVLDLTHALNLERDHNKAAERKETRPLWQLLVCFTFLMRVQIPRSDRSLIKMALRDFLDFMEKDPSIDPGGECKTRIIKLIQ